MVAYHDDLYPVSEYAEKYVIGKSFEIRTAQTGGVEVTVHRGRFDLSDNRLKLLPEAICEIP